VDTKAENLMGVDQRAVVSGIRCKWGARA